MAKGKKNVAKKFYEFLELKYPGIWKHQKNNQYMQALYPNQDANVKLKEYTIEKIRLCMLVGLVCGTLGGLLWIKSLNTNEIVHISRNEYGEGTKEEKLSLVHGNEEINFVLELEEVEYTKEELESLYDRFIKDLKQEMLGENKSFNDVKLDLNLPKVLDKYPFSVDWNVDDEFISKEGVLLNEKLEQPKVSIIMAHISANGFMRTEEIPVLVKSRKEPFSFEYKINGYLKAKEEENRNEKDFVLPNEFEGEKLIWNKRQEKTGELLFLLTPLLMAVVYYCKDRDLSKLVEERQNEIREDYPNIVSKLALYLGAGLTLQKAWEKVAKSCDKKRFAYEEMKITLREIESGVPTSTAFENFGKRCHENCYTKLVSILLQNRTKGANNASELLRSEAANAFELRKQEAVKMGEKVGTKMLVPMMLLLLVVLIIVMVPAFMNQIF